MATPLGETGDSLKGRRALVTGGTKGAGAAVTRHLSQAGATVLVTARSHPDGIAASDIITADLAAPSSSNSASSPPSAWTAACCPP